MRDRIDWVSGTDFDCVIICGGLGTRMFPLTIDNQKTLLPLDEKPLLHYIVNYWRQRCSRFIFIAGFQPEQVEAFAQTIDAPAEVIVEKKPEGIAKALAKARDIVSGPFVTVLGDCLCNGKFFFPGDMTQGVGYTHANNPLAIHQSYSLRVEKGRAMELVEKPEKLINDFLGMGVYFFTETVFKYIDRTPASPRTGKVEITDVIQRMISEGEPIHAVHFIGDYVNVTYPEDFLIADNIVRRMTAEGGDGEVEHAFSMTDTPLDGIGQIKKLLVFRTLPLSMFKQVIRFVRRTMPVKRLIALCQPSVAGEIQAMQGVDEVILFDSDIRFRLSPGARDLTRRLKSEGYDAVLIPYNNPNRTGYFHLEALAKLACGQVYGFVPPSKLLSLSWWNILRTKRLPFMRLLERGLYYGIVGMLAMRRLLTCRIRSKEGT